MKRYIFLFFILAFSKVVKAQNTPINQLKEVIVKGNIENKKNKLGQKTLKITSNQIVKNPINLTNLLRFNAPVVFKDYGNGGISTAHFRGTSATNTSVLWNGIPINSFGSGQTDFNSLSASTSDEIIVTSGGGSTENGSGAIGGTIQLNDDINFTKQYKLHLFSSFGSFKTTSNFFKTNIGTGKWAIKLASTLNYSKNNYTYIDERYKDDKGNLFKNENGVYKNYGINFGLGYKFSEINKLYFYTTGYYGNRLFSSGLPNPASGTERNEDFNQRNLIQWVYSFSKFKQLLNLSYLTQEYRYYNDKDAKKYDFGTSKNYNINYKLTYKPINYLRFNTSFLYSKYIGNTHQITKKNRNVFAMTGKIMYNPFINTKTVFSIRKETNSDFYVPISLYIGAEQNIGKNILLKSNFSKNYRVPTFNELYWPKAGNPYLVPEKATQYELGFDFVNKNLKLSSAVFYIHLNDKILWIPVSGSNVWKPININDVVNKGIETTLHFTTTFYKKHTIKLSGNYIFTKAINIENNKIIPYVPKHVFNLNTEYTVNWFKIYLQTLFQSKVYTNEINIDFYSLKRLMINNIGVEISLLKSLSVGAKVNNIGNSVYYFTNLRPMPGRNFNININYKF